MSDAYLYAAARTPFGRFNGTLAKVLRERRERWGVAAICIGVGQALAVVLENVTDEVSG